MWLALFKPSAQLPDKDDLQRRLDWTKVTRQQTSIAARAVRLAEVRSAFNSPEDIPIHSSAPPTSSRAGQAASTQSFRLTLKKGLRPSTRWRLDNVPQIEELMTEPAAFTPSGRHASRRVSARVVDQDGTETVEEDSACLQPTLPHLLYYTACLNIILTRLTRRSITVSL